MTKMHKGFEITKVAKDWFVVARPDGSQAAKGFFLTEAHAKLWIDKK